MQLWSSATISGDPLDSPSPTHCSCTTDGVVKICTEKPKMESLWTPMPFA